MASVIGYNVSEAENLMRNLIESYDSLGKTIENEWTRVVQVLQNEWIGEDEQDYEIKLVKKVNSLYTNAYNLVQTSCNTIVNMVSTWHEFQQNNTINGEKGTDIGKSEATMPSITKNEELLKAKEKTFSATDDRGLRQNSSAQTIKTSMDSYISNIDAKTKDLYYKIKSSNAFFGEQTTSIDGYISKLGDAIIQVVTSIKDLYNALDTLASTQYTSTSTESAVSFTSNLDKVDQSVSTLDTLWSGN